MMRRTTILLSVAISLMLVVVLGTTVACNDGSTNIFFPGSLTPEQLPITKPPPTKPSVSGTISGLLESDEATLHVYTETGSETLWARRGNGPWEVPVYSPDGGQYFTITAEAEGYTAEPASYRIKTEGETAYVLTNDEIGEEALHLDFQFLPCDS